MRSTDDESNAPSFVDGGDRALYLGECRTTGTSRGEEVDARGTETMVLVRTGGGWRIRHIHGSSR